MPFAKHESFYIREGWLYKGLRAVQEDAAIFVSPDAPERLGLGKNMVRALRFWMQATGLAEEMTLNRIRVQRLTSLGGIILDQDPYLELDGTLWLIHHQLISSQDQATAWYWFFNYFVPSTFSRQEFIDRLAQWINAQNQADNSEGIAEGSLRKDFDCLLHTYLPERTERGKTPEDQIECPLINLGILSGFRTLDDDSDKVVHRYRFEAGTTKNIPPLIFLYVLLSQQEKEHSGAKQVGLNVALREPMNVGRTFNIGMRGFEDLASQLENLDPIYRIHLARTAGLDQITLPSEVEASEVLDQYYMRQSALESSN